MCGFIFAPKSDSPSEDLLVLRGPDEYSQTDLSEYNLSFWRLTITGGEEGHVPLISQDSRWIVFINGEIYNFKKLMASYSLPFTHSDTQVVADGLQVLGLNFISKLRGMFAGLIYDRANDRVYIFRDFFGEKPLFYSTSKGGIRIASDFTSLRKLLSEPLRVDQSAVQDYFQFGYTLEPHTFDFNIKHVPKGQLCEVDLKNNVLKPIFVIVPDEDEYHDRTLEEITVEILSEVLAHDVPSSICFSGGIDSSAIVKLMPSNVIKTFSGYYYPQTRDRFGLQSRKIKRDAKNLGLELQNWQWNQASLDEDLNWLAACNDQPHADFAGLAYLRMFQSMRSSGTKVAFMGHGPDELFWGYDWFNHLILHSRKKSDSDMQNETLFLNQPANLTHLISSKSNSDSKVRGANLHNSIDEFLLSEDTFKRARAEVCHSYLAVNGLRQIDRLAMSQSIEARTPFADSRLYFWAQKYGSFVNSQIPKLQFLRLVLPEESIPSYAKRGFATRMYGDIQQSELISKSKFKLVEEILELRLATHLYTPEEYYRLTMLERWLLKFAH